MTVDGTPAEVEEVDGLILGVRVPPGPHEIRWKYIPGWLWPTLVVSLVAIVLTIALLFHAGSLHEGSDRHAEPHSRAWAARCCAAMDRL